MLLEVQKYLSNHTYEELTSEFGIKYSEYPTRHGTTLLCLNYSQTYDGIHAKTHPIICECRSLVLEKGSNVVVSRSLDRFFNVNEIKEDVTSDILLPGMFGYEKLDGSLISIFNYMGDVYWRTKGMINPDNVILHTVTLHDDESVTTEITWGELLRKAFDIDAYNDILKIYPDETYILELVSPYNKIVYRYNDCNLYLLATREIDGTYVERETVQFDADLFGWKLPKMHKFDSMQACIEYTKNLKDLDEGIVLYDRFGPRFKCKNPAYVAAHHIRGECTPTPKMAIKMILQNETDEFLSLFPEFKSLINPYIEARKLLISVTDELFAEIMDSNDMEELNRRDFVRSVRLRISDIFPENNKQMIIFGLIMNMCTKDNISNATALDAFNESKLETTKHKAILAFK